MNRIIMHVDMDAFFVSVEVAEKPYLRGKPVAVTGSLTTRSVIATASYEARKCGVHSAMPLFTAKKLCKNLIVIEARHDKYVVISRKLVAIYNSFCPAVESFSIDEAFLDLTYTVKDEREAVMLAKKIKALIKNKFNLPLTVGISYNKLLAKLASKLGKPDGLFVLNEKNRDRVMDGLSVEKISGIGEKTARLLREKFHVNTIRDLKKVPLMELYAVFYSYALFLHNAAFGKDSTPVIPDYEKPQEKSVGNSMTFPFDTSSWNYIKRAFKYLAEKVAMRLRTRGLFASTVVILIRYADFRTISKRKKVFATNSTDAIYFEAISLFKTVYNGRKVRLVGISVTNLSEGVPLSLFETNDRSLKIDEALDKVKLKFGDRIADYASLIDFEKKQV